MSYDIREAPRWRAVYRLLRGYGKRLQYSVFRCPLTRRQFEKLRWELERLLVEEDDIIFIGLCNGCVGRISGRNRPGAWEDETDEAAFKII